MADDIVLFAEEHRGDLPSGFDAVAQEFTVLLETGKPIDAVDRGSSLNQRIRQAALRELRDFLCSDNKKYEEVRAQGKVISRTSITSIATYVAVTAGISTAAATACVAFMALAVAKVGIGIFCRLAKDEKGTR